MAYTDQQVRDYLANVLPNASDREIAAEMVRFGVGADQMARATNQTIENVQNRFEAAQVPVNTSLSDTDVRQYLADRPGYTDAQIAADMIQFGVGPDQISRVTGLPLTDVQARYNAVLGPLQGTVTRPPVVVDTGGSTFVNPAVINIPDSLVPGNVDNRTILQTPPISRETPPTTPVNYISPEPLTVGGATMPQYTEIPAGINSLGVPLLNVRNLVNLATIPGYVAAPQSTQDLTFTPITSIGERIF